MAKPKNNILRRAAAGDREAFAAIVEEFGAGVLATARRILGNEDDARDASQEAFLRVHRHLAGFDTRRPFKPWLYRIVVNTSYDLARRRPEAGRTLDLDSIPADAGPVTPADDFAAKDALRQVLDLTRRLPLTRRIVFVLRDVEGFNCREIGDILSCPHGTVRSHLYEARRQMRDLLRAHLPELLDRRGHEMP